jgi:hypothetical protein
MSVKFIRAVNPKDVALQTMLRVLGIIRYGGHITPEEAKPFIDLCSLALPMKYRFPRSTWEEIEAGVRRAKA